jgi:hypothetical protein
MIVKPTFQGLDLIIDDTCPQRAGTTDGVVYTSYLMKPGAILRGVNVTPEDVETERDGLAGDTNLITRRHFVLHPAGIAFQNASVAGSSPTNAELEAAANWDRVYDLKNIGIVAIDTN